MSLVEVFYTAGKSLYLVGGSVRDSILGQLPHDYDYATDATPTEIKALLNRARATAVFAIGERFGTIGGIVDGKSVEITTFRSDEYVDGSRHPSVTTDRVSLIDDLGRRDFTMNAIAVSTASMDMIDPFNGYADILNKVIRAVGDPDDRFREDPLRMLRAVRFAAQLGFALEPSLVTAVQIQAHMLQTISSERIMAEMSKILMTERAGLGIDLLTDLGMMPYIIPEFMDVVQMPVGKDHKNVYEHTLQVVDQSPARLTLRWAALLHDIGKPATFSRSSGDVHFLGHEAVGANLSKRVLRRLKADNAFTDAVVQRVDMHMRVNGYMTDWTDGAVRRFVREAGDAVEDLLDLSDADVTTKNNSLRAKYRRLTDELRERILHLNEQDSIVEMKSPLDGLELMELFNRPAGQWIKEVKEHLLSFVLDGTLAQNDKETATYVAQRFMEKQNGN